MKSLVKRLSFAHFWSIIVVVGCGSLTTLLVAIYVSQLEQQALAAHFRQVAEDESFAIQAKVNGYLEPLEAVAAFYHASVTINRQEFATFVNPILAKRPGIEAIQWIPHIPEEQRIIYETVVRQETAAGYDFSQFAFMEHSQTGNGLQPWKPASTRATYYPLYYQEPLHQSGVPLGFDFGSDPSYREALAAAREQGQSVALEQPALGAQHNHSAFVIQIFYPIYAARPAATPEKPEVTSVIGFVGLVLRLHDVLDITLRDMPTQEIAVALYEQFGSPASRLLYQHLSLPAEPQTVAQGTSFPLLPGHATNALQLVKPLIPFEKQWQLVLQPTATYIAQNASWYHGVVWVWGFLGTGSIALYLAFILQRNHKAESMIRDRTEQLHQTNEQLQTTLQELQFQKSLLECTSEAAQDGILVVSPERKWLFFNQRFVDMWQLPPTIVDQRSSREGVPWILKQVANPQRARHNIEQLYADPVATAADEISLKNGAVYERFSAPVQRADGYIYARVWYFRDISQRKQAEAALQASQQQLQEHQQHEKTVIEEELARVRNQLVANTRLATLGQVAATIAHELRNPLGAVRNAVYYMRRYGVKEQQDLLEFLQLIDREVSTADRIITDLLEMSRAKEPGHQPLDLWAMVREIWPQITQQAPIHFRCVIAQEPLWVWADPTQLRQILTNLLTNAVQAMPQGGDLSIHALHQDYDVVITIQDSGPGVPPALREQIFEPLFTTKAKGTGLGLTLCRQIMEKHGGSIRLVESKQGAKFELRFRNNPSADV